MPGVLLNLGMGTGKSRIVLDIARAAKFSRVLIVAPLSVVPAWGKQADTHTPEGSVKMTLLEDGHGNVRAQKAAAAWRAGTPECPAIVVTNYACAYRPQFLQAAKTAKLDFIVADEIHALKAPQGKQSKAMAELSALIPYRLGLSGTPLPNSPMDGYGVMRFIDPGIFGKSYVAFRTRYARMGGWQQRVVIGYINQDDFARRIAPVTYEVDRSVLDLPEFVHVERTFHLNEESMKLYKTLRDDLIVSLDAGGNVTAANALTKLLRLSQIASGHVGLDILNEDFDESGRPPERTVREIHTEKEELLKDLLEEIDPSEPVVVFARFTHDIVQIRRAAKDLGGSAELSGSVNELAEWQKPNGPRVLAAQIQSGAEGIDLTRARYAVYFSKDYSRGRYLQSLARIHRPGQTRPCVYVHLIAEGTTDRLIMKALEKKGKVVDEVLDEIRKWS